MCEDHLSADVDFDRLDKNSPLRMEVWETWLRDLYPTILIERQNLTPWVIRCHLTFQHDEEHLHWLLLSHAGSAARRLLLHV